MTANQVLLQALNGLVVGSSLALVAAGLALLFGYWTSSTSPRAISS
jgi:branched-subunit amino acid ABC-type transport system permease component